MRGRTILTALLVAALSACSNGGSIPAPPAITPGPSAPALDLSPSPLQLTDDAPSDSITVSGDTPGVAYTPVADPSCTTPTGSIVVAGDGQQQVDVAGAPLMFLTYATGATPPALCGITIRGSDGSDATIAATYAINPLITDVQKHPAVHLALAPGVNPAASTITVADQILALDATGFSGTATASVNAGCASGTGIQVTPKTISGSGTFDVVAFGQGAIAKACTLTIADSAGGSVAVAVTLAIPALQKFTATPKTVQFGCAGSTSPMACQTVQSVALSEAGAQSFSVVTRPGYKTSCANAFNGPLTMTTGNGVFAQTVSGPSASVAFNGMLLGSALGCSSIIVTDNGDPAQRLTLAVKQTFATSPPPVAPAAAPPCVGPDPHVADPTAPHGMYVWNPYTVDGGIYESQLESSVIGKDPTLCGVSLVVRWSDLESQKGVYDFSEIDDPTTGLAAPYVNAGLTVNLLFEDGPERGPNNPVTPAWVTADTTGGGDGVPVVDCDSQPPAPDYMSPVFERDWFDFISHAIAHYSGNASTLAPRIGYMRFAIGFGVEAIPAHFDDGAHADCLAKWEADPVDFTYDGWVQHAKNVVNAMGRQTTDKQLLVALNGLDGGPSIYDYPDQVAEDAAGKGIGFGTENLGIANVALATSIPGACNPQAKIVNLYWCQAFTRHVGEVPFEFQTDVASTAPQPGESPIVLGKVLQYGLDNNTKIFELYPQEWMAADVAGFTTPSDQIAHRQALQDTALVLGAHR
jgi:hypothetical protein